MEEDVAFGREPAEKSEKQEISEIPDTSKKSADIQQFVERYPFPFDPFQLEAIRHLAEGQSVLVAAPTGTGKTVVAEYAIWRARQRGLRVIYTTPLKALSNQKYRDLRQLYGQEAVGLVTGDIVERSSAPIVIMTTEVYRNMLLEEGSERRLSRTTLDTVGFVVFDELHYLSDFSRGPVWEEAIICSPPTVQLVGLSATISNAEDLASWISRVHRPISLVVHEERAVPLEHYYFLDGKLRLVQDAAGNRIERFPDIGGEARLARRGRLYEAAEEEESEDDLDSDTWQERQRDGRKVRASRRRAASERSEAGGEEPQSSTSGEASNTAASVPAREGEEEKPAAKQKRPRREAPAPAEVLTALRDADLLPCLYFLPGRRVVEEAAMGAARHLFTTSEEEAFIREEIGIWLEHLPKEDRNLQQVHMLLGLLPRGLAFHHAGLLPGLKVLVETLFARGYLRAVFATDTLALGINMPARSVVVGSLSKFDGQEMRLLTPNEYSQLTGRAGRRGMDTRGAAVIPYSPWEPFEASFEHITGELHPVTSSFVIRYNSVLNLWRPGDVQYLRRICASSLREYQRYRLWELNELYSLERRFRKARKSRKKMVRAESAWEEFEKRRARIGAYPLSRAGAAELDGTIFALRALGYIGQDDQLTLKGRLLRGIFHPAGLAIVEMITAGLLDELSPGELAEVCSWFTYDSDRRLHNRHVLNSRLQKVRREFWYIAEHIRGIEERAGIAFTPGIVPEFHGLALSWSRNTTLGGLIKRIDLAEGDILMLLNQTIDLVQQVQAAVGQVLDDPSVWEYVPPVLTEGSNRRTAAARAEARAEQIRAQRERLARLRPALAQGAALLLHGIIVQSRTLPSMTARIGDEVVPLDAEEDRDPAGLHDPEAFAGEV
ncbi:MAG: DEAD/DEAH box helicase [Ktedonobacteraceae bacterium]|nr:DEAD/DEAH box helicase [Ktedonobacteraceae bacterium]